VKKLALYLLTFICGTPVAMAQDYEEVAIDSILSVKLPLGHYNYIENDSIDQITRFITQGVVDDIIYTVYRVRTQDRICLSNRKEMKIHYKEINDFLMDGEFGQRVKYNSTFIDNDVYQGVLEYNDIDPIDQELYNSDNRFIQIKETLYQISLYQPAKYVSKSTADNFFNSVKINDTYTKKNQYTTCNSLDLLFDTPPKSDRTSAYETGYYWGYIMGGFICVAFVLGLIALVIVLLIRKNKKNSQKEWDQFNK
jgi:hypothetical protein